MGEWSDLNRLQLFSLPSLRPAFPVSSIRHKKGCAHPSSLRIAKRRDGEDGFRLIRPFASNPKQGADLTGSGRGVVGISIR